MSISTLAIIGVLVLVVIAIVVYVVLRLAGERAHDPKEMQSTMKARRNAVKRSKLR